MRRLIRGKMWILPLVVLVFLGGSAACERSGDTRAGAINWAKLIRVKKNPVRISPLVREMKGSDSFFKAEITNVSKVPLQTIDGTIVLLSDKGFVVEARPYSEHSVIPPGGKNEMKISFTDPQIHSAKFVLKQATYIAGTTSDEAKGPVFGGWANPKYDAELGAAKNYPPIGK